MDSWRVSFLFEENEIRSTQCFERIVDLSREVFKYGQFSHGAYRTEYEEPVPTDAEAVGASIVSFYSKTNSRTIGREKLLSAPTERTEELSNGGIMLLACLKPRGCVDEISALRDHLR